jgi:hypothetical protein
MSEFSARAVQFVWFVTDTGKLDAGELLKALLKSEPDSINRNRVPSPSMPYLSSAKRDEGSLSVTLNVSPGRVDLIVQPEQHADMSLGRPAELDAKQVMLQFLTRFDSDNGFAISGVYRIAVVCNYIDIFDQYAGAKAAFFNKVGVPEVLGDVTDLVFQINKKFSFDTLKISVNRLLTATIEMMQQVQVLGGSPAIDFLSSGRVVKESFILSLNVDVNNAPEAGREFSEVEVRAGMKRFVEENLRLRQLKQIGEF